MFLWGLLKAGHHQSHRKWLPRPPSTAACCSCCRLHQWQLHPSSCSGPSHQHRPRLCSVIPPHPNHLLICPNCFKLLLSLAGISAARSCLVFLSPLPPAVCSHQLEARVICSSGSQMCHPSGQSPPPGSELLTTEASAPQGLHGLPSPASHQLQPPRPPCVS